METTIPIDLAQLAEVDQLGAALVAIAPAVRQYHAALVAEGFSEDQARDLTVAYQLWLLS